MHFADVPPGQAKYVSCIRGAVLDVVVDLRLGSPTFGRWEGVRLDDVERTAVYLSERLGHGFCALTEEATVMYLCSTTYNPEREHAINPCDAALGIAWPAADPIVSPRDLAAPASTRSASGDCCLSTGPASRMRRPAGRARTPCRAGPHGQRVAASTNLTSSAAKVRRSAGSQSPVYASKTLFCH